jgi:anthranilate phosphoribosyltransferase
VPDPAPVELLRRIISGGDLSREEMEGLVGRLMDGEVEAPLQAALLAALATKGETVAELAGAASAMRRRVLRVAHGRQGVIDTCGTGGDGKGTFNISTAAALVAAAAGVPVAKHGNRSVSSRSGSADVLEALGVAIDLDAAQAGRCLDELGISFLFAQRLHPAMREVGAVRRALGVRTIFNVLGPLTNPAGAGRQLMGVFAEELVGRVAAVLLELGCERAWVVHGSDGLDEITTTGPTHVAEVRDGKVRRFELEPEVLGFERVPIAALAGGSPEDNAQALERLLEGAPGPLHDVTALNAGAALLVGGVAEELTEGIERAREAIASRAARELLDRLRAFDPAPPEVEAS